MKKIYKPRKDISHVVKFRQETMHEYVKSLGKSKVSDIDLRAILFFLFKRIEAHLLNGETINIENFCSFYSKIKTDIEKTNRGKVRLAKIKLDAKFKKFLQKLIDKDMTFEVM